MLRTPTLADFRVLLTLAIPLICSGLIEGSVGFFSTLFLAHLGKNALAAGALVTWLFATLMVILWGTLTTVSVLVSRKYGEQDTRGIGLVLRDSLLFSALISLPVFLLLWYLPDLFLLFGQTPEIVALMRAYLHGLAFGVLPDFIGLVLLQFVIGLGQTRTNMLFSLLWVPINIVLNFLLIYGKCGLPQLGIAGIGWGTTLAYWLTTLGFLLYIACRKIYRPYLAALTDFSRPQYLGNILQTGLPMGGMYCFELGFFLVLTLFMGYLGKEVLAANQVTMQFLGQFTTISFAMAGAITIRMGHTLGAKQIQEAQRTASAGVCIVGCIMLLIALVYWFFPGWLLGIDFALEDPANATIIALAKKMMALAAIFQLFEGIRIALYGALRSLEDTRFTFFTSIISFWCIPVPLTYLFAIVFQWQAQGAWFAMILGAISGSLILYKRFVYKISQLAH